MNITLELQELDDLIVKHTQPPITPILRNKLHLLRDQMEAYIDAKDKEAVEHARLAEAHEALKLAQAKPTPQSPADSFEHRRGLYYKTGDPVPFCPRCWEAKTRKIHLFGPVEMMDESVEYWECRTCRDNYTAKPGENFMPRPGANFSSW